MKEILRRVEGYEGLYLVSNLGRVFNAKNKKEMAVKINKDGHPSVRLCKNNQRKDFYISKLVADAFLSPLDFKAYIEHIDGDITNNNYLNLRYKFPAAEKDRVINKSSIRHKGLSHNKIIVEWIAPVTGYAGLYKVSDYGRVFDAQTGEQVPLNARYTLNYKRPYVDLVKNGKTETIQVAQLVAREFIEGGDRSSMIYYVNNNPWDLRWGNLSTRPPHIYRVIGELTVAEILAEDKKSIDEQLYDIEREEMTEIQEQAENLREYGGDNDQEELDNLEREIQTFGHEKMNPLELLEKLENISRAKSKRFHNKYVKNR